MGMGSAAAGKVRAESSASPPETPSAVTSIPKADGHIQRNKRRIHETDFRMEIVTDHARLQEIIPQWSELASRSIEPNPFYEHWFVLPALRHFPHDPGLRFILIWQSGLRPGESEKLVAMFPLQRQHKTWQQPLNCDRLWQHDYTYLCTPLVDSENTAIILTEFFKWTRTTACGASFLELPHIHGEGPFQHALLEAMERQSVFSLVSHQYGRALFRRAASAEIYLDQATTSHHRQELRRQRRRLAEQGQFETLELNAGENVDPWVDLFLQLEGGGWKGQQQTALSSLSHHAQWFRDVCRAAQERGQLMMLGLFLNGQAIAVKCNFLAGDGGFTFKIGFDEAYAKFSPGVQLEIENIGFAHQKPDLNWLDSCAAPGHFMISRLWPERRTIQRLLVSTGRWGDLSMAARFGLRALRRVIKPPQQTAMAEN
ncbi:GNAT family N-acetyltransferase [Planctopirus hydrillae]|uniref:BioF2-like acetyltransferase domain-containing protein n=1 Tax=Planctopirus hydrillae TaxID=1841610 RepID=A0A1C3EHL8_9PLAN|nr:GNAT family N-acetyltransferase [Planctopirus hydrillae]ODA32699.1 hypothetical protein A6X21_20345 [Planctopirus hydrillae]